jgi:DNA-binding IclR family transcriptional regulator
VPGLIQSVERAAAIIRLLAASSQRLRLADVSASLQLPKATAHGLLTTLVSVGFVEQDRVSGQYQLSPGLLDLSSPLLDVNELRARSFNWVDPLAARTGEAVWVGILVGTQVVVAHHLLRPTQAPRVAVKPETLPLHATALGKVLLAYHPAPLHLLPAQPPTYTASTIVDRRSMVAELDRIRTQGYATDLGEHVPEQASIAAPIKGFGGLVVAAVAVYGKTERICDSTGRARPTVLSQVNTCAQAITRELAVVRTER